MIRAAIMNKFYFILLIICFLGCSEEPIPQDLTSSNSHPLESNSIPRNPLKNVYFGDTHVHTDLSFDAFLFGTRKTPDDAYYFGKGQKVKHAYGFNMQIKKPLDFMAVSDHAYYLGVLRHLSKSTSGDHTKFSTLLQETKTADDVFEVLAQTMRYLNQPSDKTIFDNKDVVRSSWQEVIDAAERHNQPGKFTTFIAYEYTSGSVFSGPNPDNLHRNVIYRSSSVPIEPYSRLDSRNPENLWSWMDKKRAEGMDSLAIPHNMNRSNGKMFETAKWDDSRIDAQWAEQRLRNEPIVENSQVKGTSDTHPLLSPNDEWADFEILPSTNKRDLNGSYVRQALIKGLVMKEKLGFNPYQFGVIAASDTHNAAGSFGEANYWSKTGLLDNPAHRRGSVPLPEPAEDVSVYSDDASRYWGASGLAGVWAESNTRESIFEALRSKETFSTSGPRIKLRFFAGADLDESLIKSDNSIQQAYEKGVPMGSELQLQAKTAPSFYVWAVRDPDSYPLQRLQIVKGWVEAGEGQESVIDIACSDRLSVDPKTNRCPDNDAKVDFSDCSVTPNKGDSEMSAVWTDKNYQTAQRAFYYVRVLENPSCRWSTYDALRAGVQPRPGTHKSIQERAWSSPIWVNNRL